MILNNTIDIKNNIVPNIIVPIAISVEGTEKILVSLKNDITIMVKIMPMQQKIIPGSPRNFKGCFIATSSTNDVKTSEECDTGFFVDVLYPVL